MIRVRRAREPTGFDEEVRQPDLRAIAARVGERSLPGTKRGPGRPGKRAIVAQNAVNRREDLPPTAFPMLWQGVWLDALLKAYDRICAYVCIYIEPVTGAASVDHWVPKSVAWHKVYEWDNYRLACSLMNSRKGKAQEVLDPFEVETGWFQLELTGFQIRPAPALDSALHVDVEQTIHALELNDSACRGLRQQYAEDYRAGDISLAYLQRRAPFVALELCRQHQLRDEDRPTPIPQEP